MVTAQQRQRMVSREQAIAKYLSPTLFIVVIGLSVAYFIDQVLLWRSSANSATRYDTINYRESPHGAPFPGFLVCPIGQGIKFAPQPIGPTFVGKLCNLIDTSTFQPEPFACVVDTTSIPGCLNYFTDKIEYTQLARLGMAVTVDLAINTTVSDPNNLNQIAQVVFYNQSVRNIIDIIPVLTLDAINIAGSPTYTVRLDISATRDDIHPTQNSLLGDGYRWTYNAVYTQIVNDPVNKTVGPDGVYHARLGFIIRMGNLEVPVSVRYQPLNFFGVLSALGGIVSLLLSVMAVLIFESYDGTKARVLKCPNPIRMCLGLPPIDEENDPNCCCWGNTATRSSVGSDNSVPFLAANNNAATHETPYDSVSAIAQVRATRTSSSAAPALGGAHVIDGTPASSVQPVSH